MRAVISAIAGLGGFPAPAAPAPATPAAADAPTPARAGAAAAAAQGPGGTPAGGGAAAGTPPPPPIGQHMRTAIALGDEPLHGATLRHAFSAYQPTLLEEPGLQAHLQQQQQQGGAAAAAAPVRWLTGRQLWRAMPLSVALQVRALAAFCVPRSRLMSPKGWGRESFGITLPAHREAACGRASGA